MFWDEDEEGNTYATEAYYEYAEAGTYTLESGEEYQSWNGRYTLLESFITENGIIDSGYEDDEREYSNTNKLQQAWSEFYGGEYEFPIDKLWAEDRIALRPLSLVSFLPQLDDDMQMIRDAIGAVVEQKGWQMVYAADEEEFEALWQQMKSDALALGAEQVQTWIQDQIAAAEEAAAKYE